MVDQVEKDSDHEQNSEEQVQQHEHVDQVVFLIQH